MFLENNFFDTIPTFFVIFFIIIIGTIIFIIVKSLSQGVKNSNSPVIVEPARVIAKRIDVSGDHSYTTYYATFEVQNGMRMELAVKGAEYGLLAERDDGTLSYQGTRYLSFERQK